MLAEADAALIIGDNALFLDGGNLEIGGGGVARMVTVQKVDLGDLWLRTTGLPFVYAFWAGRPGSIGPETVRVLKQTRDRSLAKTTGDRGVLLSGGCRATGSRGPVPAG